MILPKLHNYTWVVERMRKNIDLNIWYPLKRNLCDYFELHLGHVKLNICKEINYRI